MFESEEQRRAMLAEWGTARTARGSFPSLYDAQPVEPLDARSVGPTLLVTRQTAEEFTLVAGAAIEEVSQTSSERRLGPFLIVDAIPQDDGEFVSLRLEDAS